MIARPHSDTVGIVLPDSLRQPAEQPSPPAVFPSSHCSPVSTTPFPQTATQSLSVAALQPARQHPSP